MNSFLVWLNIALYGSAALAAFGSLNKMHISSTRPCLIAAVLLLAIGCVGQAAGQLTSQWDHISDTMVAGGLLALLISSQRVHTWFLERWANPIASVLAVGIGALFVAWLLGGCAAVPKPICESPEFRVWRNQQGQQFYALDQANVEILAATLLRLEAGQCSIGQADLDGAGS